MAQPEHLLTVEDVARLLRTSKQAVYSMRSKVPAFPKAIRLGRRVLWKPEDIEAFIEAHREEG